MQTLWVIITKHESVSPSSLILKSGKLITNENLRATLSRHSVSMAWEAAAYLSSGVLPEPNIIE